jgi:hypothetical protein
MYAVNCASPEGAMTVNKYFPRYDLGDTLKISYKNVK